MISLYYGVVLVRKLMRAVRDFSYTGPYVEQLMSASNTSLAIKQVYEKFDDFPLSEREKASDCIWDALDRGEWLFDLDITAIVDLHDPEICGSGSFSRVFRGTLCGKVVAVKILKTDDDIKEILASPKTHLAFFREVKIWQSIERHENVLPMLGYFFKKNANQLGFVSPFAEMDLRLWAQAKRFRNDPEDDQWRYKLIRDVACGLQHLHTRKPRVIIHGDLRPPNILIVDGQAKIGDFGISKLGEEIGSLTMSEDRATLKNSGLAPELCGYPRQPRNQASDVYAWAITTIEVFTGVNPYFEIDPPSIPDNIENSVVREILNHCLSLMPSQRGSATDIVQKLPLVGDTGPFSYLTEEDLSLIPKDSQGTRERSLSL
ncbi:kinase-like domain-containing protein [Mycena floridula]|nr:kinase-like domain-containing protein [Mycena floridula]